MYISRQGQFATKDDLVATEHGNLPNWAHDDPFVFWKEADKHERENGAVYREHIIAVPNECSNQGQLNLVSAYVQEIVGPRPYQWALHCPTSSLEGLPNTHAHVMFSDRADDGIERPPSQTFMRHNPRQPELGGRRKGTGGKTRAEVSEALIETRKKFADLQNAALEQAGHSARVDHRSLKDRGIARPPERHLGPSLLRNLPEHDRQAYLKARAHNRQSDEVATAC
ncbi:MobA/MobL family protein [Pigmentiphaga litoralis]|uniref:MobA/MobL family protein n=1 Tax=Pigmentiphaga litoralis TaxID=516702 RepID=UPI001E45A81E|nr:MobA/MobL family protein [Pigmentiphaga litoralis]